MPVLKFLYLLTFGERIYFNRAEYFSHRVGIDTLTGTRMIGVICSGVEQCNGDYMDFNRKPAHRT